MMLPPFTVTEAMTAAVYATLARLWVLDSPPTSTVHFSRAPTPGMVKHWISTSFTVTLHLVAM
jgi:hypothetical protein